MSETPEIKASDIQKFLSTPENPVKTAEFMEFWKGLTDAEKAEYKANLR